MKVIFSGITSLTNNRGDYLYHNLFGKLEYENQYGMLKTDYTMLKPGLLHKANGGYLVLQVKDLLTINCFGIFEVLHNGQPISFKRTKAKERSFFTL